jgi:flagellar biosynthesis/type III secretory pathway protein FliH
MEKKEIQNRLEEFIDKVWGTSCFAETPFNNYTEEKRERDYDKAMEDMIGFIQQELDKAREEGYQEGFEDGLNKANEDEQYIKYRK